MFISRLLYICTSAVPQTTFCCYCKILNGNYDVQYSPILTLLFLILLTKDECKANLNHTLTLWRSFQFSFVEIPSHGNYKSGRKLLLQLNACKQYASSKSFLNLIYTSHIPIIALPNRIIFSCLINQITCCCSYFIEPWSSHFGWKFSIICSTCPFHSSLRI